MSDQLHFVHDAAPGRPGLLLLHGFLASHVQWNPNMGNPNMGQPNMGQALTGADTAGRPEEDGLNQRFAVTRAELWGHGASPVPDDPDAWRIEHYIAQFETYRAALGIDRWLIGGHSFGAGIMIRYACAHPDRVSGLILTNSRSAFDPELAHNRPRHSLEEWRAIKPNSLPYHPRFARRFPADLKRRMSADADKVSAETLWRSTTITGPALCCRSLLGEIPVPVLLINGRWEKRFQPHRDYAATAIPGVRIADLDGGHSVNIEAPGAFNQAVIRFAEMMV